METRTKKARLSPADFQTQLHWQLNESGRAFSVIVVQLNRTDRMSALAQDQASLAVMRQTVERIEPLLKASDFYCVVAHDEIWLSLDELATESVLSLAAASLRSALKPVFTIQRSASVVRTIRMNPVVGAVMVPAVQTDVHEVLHLMDEALTQAKRSDSLTCILRASESSGVGKRAQLETELRQALFANELEVYFQPQVSLIHNKCVSAEALIRWTRSNGKPVNAGLIAQVCEETGLMEQLTRYVLNNVLRTLTGIRSQGLDLKVAINLSAGTLSNDEFPELVLQSCETWGVPPSCLVFEITEGSLVQHEKAAQFFLEALRDLGCEISIDDFGTGYSSLAYLKKYPFSELKIDRSFVQDLEQNESSIKLVRVLADLSRTMGLRCVAEGIENEIAQTLLKKMGVDLGQGYHFARALPAGEFVDWATRFNRKAA